MTSASDSLLAAVRTGVVIDVDSMDAAVASTHAPIANFSDMTSNQAIAHSAALRPENASLLDAAVAASTSSTAEDVQDVLDRFTVLLAASVLPHISGRVHAQVSPKAAYSTEATVTHVRRLVQLFADRGISRDRVCIKIPATPESMIACAELEKEGIRTLATCLFSLPQAIAAVQAGCLYVAPYFNELAVHFTPNLWKDYPSPSHDHPSSPVIHSITTAFRSLNAKTLVMPASIVTAREVLGLLALRPDHLTLSPAVLAELASTPAVSLPLPDPLPLLAKDSRVETDYLVDGASALREAIDADRECARKLADALRIFGEEEDALGALVRARIAAARG